MVPPGSVTDAGPAAGTDRRPAAGRPRGTRAAEVDVATHVARGVLGAGMIVVPPVVAAVAQGADLALWVAHLVLGGTVCVLLASSTARAGRRPMPVSGVAGAALGSWARVTTDLCFAVAFAAGQAAIVWFVVSALRTGAGAPAEDGRWLMVALAGVLAAVLVAVSPLRIPDAVLRARPWVAGALAVACAASGWPGDLSSGGGPAWAPDGVAGAAGLWLAFAALLFAGVGWEAVTEAGAENLPSPRRTVTGAVLGAVVVAVVHLGLAALRRWGPVTPAGADAAALRWGLGAATVVVLGSYVVTNLRTAAGIAGRLRPAGGGAPAPARALVAAVGATSCALLVLSGGRDGAVLLLLLGPAAAATVAYALACAGEARHGGPLARWVGGAVVVLLAVFASLAVPALSTVGT